VWCAFSLHDFNSIKEQIRQRVDLVELVSEHVALTRRGSDFWGPCPFHKEKAPSFHVVPDKEMFHCFGCKVGGDVFKFVQLIEGVPFGEAVRMLADRAGVELAHRSRGDASGPGRVDIGRVNAWAAEFYRRQLLHPERGRDVRAYLARRAVSEETSQRFGLGLALDDGSGLRQAARLAGHSEALLAAAGLLRSNERGSYDTFRHRLIFPIRDTTRRVIGFGGRTLGDAQAKYLNTAQNQLFDKSRTLYGIDLARAEIAASGRAIIVEGYTDCMACHQAGFRETVATLGTAMTEAHVDLLRRYGQEIILVFDSDAAGATAAERALSVALRYGLSVRLAFVPQGKDPCEFLKAAGPEAFAGVLNSAGEALRFVWDRTQERFKAETGDAGRRRAVLEFTGLVSGLAQAGAVDAIQKGLIANQVAKLLDLPGEEVHRLLGGRRHSPGRGGDPVPRPQEPPCGGPTAEQAALTWMLEVLLNEPGLYGTVREVFDPQRFADPGLRRIASGVVALAERLGEFTLAELLSHFTDPADAQRITELHIRGTERANWDATLAGAAACLKQVAAVREAAAWGRNGQPADGCHGEASEEASTSARLRAIQQASHAFAHFAPRSEQSGARELTP